MRRLLIPLLIIPVLAVAGLAALLIPRAESASPRLAGDVLPGKRAPTFALRDQSGKLVSLRSFAGEPVVLTFMQATCTQLCPIVAQEIQRAVTDVRHSGGNIGVVAISADPEHDTHQALLSFLRRHDLTGWHYLTASRAQLSPVWRGYYLYVAPPSAPKVLRNAHTSATYVLDGSGHERVLMVASFPPPVLDRDLRILAGLPAASGSSVAAPVPGHMAPGFTLSGLAGRSISLRSLRGHPVLVNFWATWCPACRREMPLLEKTYRDLSHRGLVVLGVDNQEDAASVRVYTRQAGATYPMVLDSSGTAEGQYDLGFLPNSYLIGPDGRIMAASQGAVTPAWIKAHVTPLVDGTGLG